MYISESSLGLFMSQSDDFTGLPGPLSHTTAPSDVHQISVLNRRLQEVGARFDTASLPAMQRRTWHDY